MVTVNCKSTWSGLMYFVNSYYLLYFNFFFLYLATEYYLGFFKNATPRDKSQLLVTLVNTLQTPANFSIEAPGTRLLRREVIDGDSDVVVALPSTLTVLTTNDINKGIHLKIESDGVLVFGQNEKHYSSDTFLALPYQRLANVAEYEYYAMSAPPECSVVFQGSLLVVGTEDNTKMKLTVTQTATATPANTLTANIEYSFVINRLQTFYVRSEGDLSGTKIVTDKPVSVFSGHEGACIPPLSHMCCPGKLVEHIPPITSWGTTFYVTPLGTRSYGIMKSTIKILASKDSTNIKIYCDNIEENIALDEGQHYNKTLSLQENCAVISSNPVLVVQLSHSCGDNSYGGFGDPMMMIIPDILQYTNIFRISTIRHPRGINYEHHINLVVLKNFFEPDKIYVVSGGSKVSLSSQDWVPIKVNNVTKAYATQVTISEGVADIFHSDSAALMTVNVYGFANGDSYGHPGRLTSKYRFQLCMHVAMLLLSTI